MALGASSPSSPPAVGSGCCGSGCCWSGCWSPRHVPGCSACPLAPSLPPAPDLIGDVSQSPTRAKHSGETLLSQPRLKASRHHSSGTQASSGTECVFLWGGTNPAGLYRGMRRPGSGVPSHPSRFSLRSPQPTFRAGGGAGQGRADGAAPAAVTNGAAPLFKSTRSCQSFSSSSASLQSPYWARLLLFFSVSLLLRGGGAIGRGITSTSAIATGGGPAPRGQRRAPLLSRPGLPGGGSGGSRGSSPGRRLCKGASSPLLRGPRASGAEAGPQRGAARSGGAERSRRAEPLGAGK